MGNSNSQQKPKAQVKHTQILIAAVKKVAFTHDAIDLDEVKAALKAGADVNHRFSISETGPHTWGTSLMLLLNISNNNIRSANKTKNELIKLLLTYGAELPSRNIYMVYLNKIPAETFKIMLEHGFDVTKSWQRGKPLIYEFINNSNWEQATTLIEHAPEWLDDESTKLPGLVYYYAKRDFEILSDEYRVLPLMLLLSLGARVAPDIIGLSLQATADKQVDLDPEELESRRLLLREFFKFWVSLFIHAGEQQSLIEELTKPEVQQAFNNVNATLSLTCVGLSEKTAQELANHLKPAKLINLSLAQLAHYHITKIDLDGVHFSQNAATTTTSSLPEQFSLSLVDFRLVLKENPGNTTLIMLLSSYIPMTRNFIVAKFMKSYQAWLKRQSGVDKQKLRQNEATAQFSDEVNLYLQLKKEPDEAELEALFQAGANINEVFYTRFGLASAMHHLIFESAESGKHIQFLFQFLLKHGAAFPKSFDESEFLKKCLYNKLEIAIHLLEMGEIPLALQDSEGNGLLHYASSFKMAQYLVNKGLSVHNQNHQGDTPLYSTKFYGDVGERLTINDLLLNRGASVGIRIFTSMLTDEIYTRAYLYEALYYPQAIYWVKYFVAKDEIDALATVLANPRMKMIDCQQTSFTFINLAENHFAKLKTLLPHAQLLNLSLEDFLTHEITAITAEGITFTKPAGTTTGNSTESFSLSLIEFKLVLQKFLTRSSLAEKFTQSLKEAKNESGCPVVEEFLTTYREMLKLSLYQRQQNITSLQLVGTGFRLFDCDLKVVTEDRPASSPGPSHTPG